MVPVGGGSIYIFARGLCGPRHVRGRGSYRTARGLRGRVKKSGGRAAESVAGEQLAKKKCLGSGQEGQQPARRQPPPKAVMACCKIGVDFVVRRARIEVRAFPALHIQIDSPALLVSHKPRTARARASLEIW